MFLAPEAFHFRVIGKAVAVSHSMGRSSEEVKISEATTLIRTPLIIFTNLKMHACSSGFGECVVDYALTDAPMEIA